MMAHVEEVHEPTASHSHWSEGLTTTLILFLSVFIVLLWYTRREKYLAPGPLFPLTLLLKLNTSNKRHHILTNYSLKYGPIYSFRFLHLLTVVLNTITVAKEALVDQAEVFSERFAGKAVKIASGGAEGSILMGNGEHYKELRRFGAYSLRSFGVGKRSLGNKINEESGHLIEVIQKEGNKLFHPDHVISNAVSNIICSISFGDRYEYDDPIFHQLLEALHSFSSESPFNLLLLICPYLIYVPPYHNRLKRQEFLRSFVCDIIEEHRATLDPNDMRDIIDMFLIEADQKKKETFHANAYDTSRLWRTIFDLFAAGSETTANSLLWAIAIFCHHPNIQEKMYEEVKAVLGTEKLPVYEDRHRLPYTQAVLLEIQRFRPVVPAIPYVSSGDAVVGGYHIPKGTRVLLNLWKVHHDPQEWKDPELFVPERFLNFDQKICLPDAHVPFSLGRRVCLGETLAKMELFLFLTSLVQRFRFYVPDGMELPSLDGVFGITLSPEPYEVCAEPRNELLTLLTEE